MVHGASEEQLHSDLWEALRLELIVRSDDSYRFVHDRVQEAAYSLIPEEQRAAAHLRIGRLLTTQIAPDKREEAVFEIVGHFNRASVPDHLTRRTRAGCRAQSPGRQARQEGRGLRLGAELSDRRLGIARPETAGSGTISLFELELHRAECEFLTGDVASAEERLRMLSSRAPSRGRASARSSACRPDVYIALQQPDRGLSRWRSSACVTRGSRFRCARRRRRRRLRIRPDLLEARWHWDRRGRRAAVDDRSRVACNPRCARQDFAGGVGRRRQLADLDRRAPPSISAWSVASTTAACFAFEYLGYLAGWRFGDFDDCFRFGQLGYELIETQRAAAVRGL